MNSLRRYRWHEWLNRHSTPHCYALAQRLAKTSTHLDIIRYLYINRPRGQMASFDGCAFWEDWHNRLMLLLALISRPGTVSDFTRHAGIPDEKPYTYLREWGLEFRSFTPPPRITASGEGRAVQGQLRYNVKTNAYYLHDNGRDFQVQYHPYPRDEWTIVYDSGPDLTLAHALLAARACTRPVLVRAPSAVHKAALIEQLDMYSRVTSGANVVVGKTDDEGRVPLRVLMDVFGHDAVEYATAKQNRCGCQYWDDVSGACGLTGKRPTSRCEDFEPLELNMERVAA